MSDPSTDRRVGRIVDAMTKAAQGGDPVALEAKDASVPLGDVANALIGWIREQLDSQGPRSQDPRGTAARAEREGAARDFASWNTGTAFLALIEASPLAIIALDAAGRVTIWNPAAEAIFGWTEGEALGRSLPYVPEDKREEHRLLRERVLRGESFTNLEARRRRKDGSAVDISISTAPLFDSDGRITGIMSLNADVTERRRVLEELEYREQIYRGLFENMALGVVYQSADGQIISANPAAERILGLSLEALRSRTSLDPNWHCIREDGSEFPGDQHPSMQALASGRPVNGVVMGVRQSDSRELRWLLLDATPEFHPGEAKPYQVFTTFSDITERKRAAEALDRSTRLLKEVQRLARLGHYDLDAETGLWQSSEVLNEIFGIDETFHRDVEAWLELVHPDDRQEMATYLNDHVLSAHQPFDREYRIVRCSDGQERWVYGRGQVVVDARGSVKRMIGTIQDITERKKLEERVAQSQKLEAVGQLAGGIAHDFNNMLSVILGYAELIKVRHPGEDLLLEDILEIEKAATHSKDVTSQLLAFSRKQIISPRTTDLNELILKAERTLLPLIGENIQLRIFLAEDLAPIRFDPSQIEQILVNLAVNARDAMPEGGLLT
ncbi:MAG: PAS domain S-box protein, partial [Acidobacteriota bacterium]